MIDYIVIILFILAMMANVIALIRHHRTLRLMSHVLEGMITAHDEYTRAVEENTNAKKVRGNP